MFFRRPHESAATFAPVCTRFVAVGAPQKPVWPGGGPNRTCPSGHFGAGPLGALAAGLGKTAVSKTFLLPAARTTELAHTCRLPFRAAIPCTVNESPGFTASRVQPPRP